MSEVPAMMAMTDEMINEQAKKVQPPVKQKKVRVKDPEATNAKVAKKKARKKAKKALAKKSVGQVLNTLNVTIKGPKSEKRTKTFVTKKTRAQADNEAGQALNAREGKV